VSNKKRAELLTALAILSGSIGLAVANAAEVGIPDTFPAGGPAGASEANANFAAVESGADGSARAIPILRSDAQASKGATGGLFLAVADTVVGRGPIDAYGDLPENSLSSGHLLGLSSTGYFFGVSPGGVLDEGALQIVDTYFDQENCTGNKYVAYMYVATPMFILRQGIVVGATDPGDAIHAYSAKGTPVTVSLRSSQTRATSTAVSCTNYPAGFANQAVRLVPNDEAVTGVPSHLAGPLSVVSR
jgi:hypothetical protein